MESILNKPAQHDFARRSRVLVIDDEESIQFTFQSILCGLKGRAKRSPPPADAKGQPLYAFEVDCAFSGEEGLTKTQRAAQGGRPFAVAFVDVRLPGGWDGLETIPRLWEVSPELQIVICTGQGNFSWTEVVNTLGESDRLLILKKPFERAEVLQAASALSEKWELQRQVARNVHSLEDLVRERTREIEQAGQELLQLNRQLAAAKEAAEVANRAKTEFLANMSHEMRTPLTAVLGFSELLLDPEHTAEDRREWVETIHRNADQLLGVINNVLDISAIETCRMTVQSLTCSPREILQQVAERMQTTCEQKALVFELQIEEPVPQTVETDPDRLEQILTNLVDNAVKFTAEGSVRIVLRQSRLPSISLPCLNFEVTDTGIGIPAEKMNRLFEAFSQGDSSTSRQFSGTGLGLAISKRLAQLLGGDIEAESTPDRGSTFRLLLPLGIPHTPEDRTPFPEPEQPVESETAP